MNNPKRGLVRILLLLPATVLLLLTITSIASAFVPPPCEDDPSRVIFAGVGDAPCKKFTGDEDSCELAYYLSDGDSDSDLRTTASCFYVEGTCVGCGGYNLVCPTNTCNSRDNGVATTACIGDSDRTALLGVGDNGSERCRNLDATDQATCENAYYHVPTDDDDDSVFGNAVACFWESTSGSCRGCGDNGNACPFNACDPTVEPPDAECALDSGRTNLLGYGGNGSNRCRLLDDTDQGTCENAFYEDDDTGLPVACWWDGDECRGSGFDDFFAFNECLTTFEPPSPTAICNREPDRTALGFGNNGTGPCRALDDTDQATCESAFYEDAEDGIGVACWWDGDECRGSLDDFRAQNACQIAPSPPSAVCADGRTNLIGFGRNNDHACRQLDDTDEATCENAYYQNEDNGIAVACNWSGDNCRGCSGRSDCSENACIEPTCAGDPARTNLTGFGSNGQGTGQNGGACRQFDDQASCEVSFYLSQDTGQGVACWWDGDTCRGSSSNFSNNNACFVGAVCTREPGRSSLGFGNNGSQPCRQHDGNQTSCEDSYYEDRDTGQAYACWWAPGDLCLGSRGRNELLNACVYDPIDPAVTCTGEPGRQTEVGFGNNRSGDDGGACRSLDNTDEATCEDAFYHVVESLAPVACWWDGDECRGSVNYSQNNACDPRQLPCPFDMDRTTYLGSSTSNPCEVYNSGNGGDQATCEDAYFADVEGAPAPVACWWDGINCNAATEGAALRNTCLYENVPTSPLNPTCGDRTNHIGFGSENIGQTNGACRQFDNTDQATCENAFYSLEDRAKTVACWWDDGPCRGSNGAFSAENTCAPVVPCHLDPDRTTIVGFGSDGSRPCRQFDDSEGGDQTLCENAYYIDDEDLLPIACWWDGDECRGSAFDGVNNFDLNNSCLRASAPPTTCAGRTDFLGLGNNGDDTCRALSETSQSECEDAFYLDAELLKPTACTWSEGADQCTGTTRWTSLNACDEQTPPSCDARTLIGKGDRGGIGNSGGACRQFDDEPTCENAYYVNRENQPVACWWDGSSCRGTNRSPRSPENVCVPEVACTGRLTVAGFGGNGQRPCRSFDNSDEATCEDAYYIERGGTPIACNWDATDSQCLACGRRGGSGTCLVNECAPVECAGDPGRTQVRQCRDLNTIAECEDAWHVLGDDAFAPIASSCFWDAERNECFGCGPPSQGEDQCANACETGCGNGVLDGGETCDDGNMYDGDCCDSSCQLEADDSPCTDRLFCTEGGGTCQSGVCIGAPPRPCASCFTEDCSEATNECSNSDNESGPAVAAVLSGGAPPGPPSLGMPLPPGTECDDGIPGTDSVCNGNGLCVGEFVVPSTTPTRTPSNTQTPTATPSPTTTLTRTITPTATPSRTPTTTPTPTITGTPTSTPTITPTPIPIGGPCADSDQCGPGAACVEGFCALVAAPAPATSNNALLAIVAALLAVAALSLRLRRRQS